MRSMDQEMYHTAERLRSLNQAMRFAGALREDAENKYDQAGQFRKLWIWYLEKANQDPTGRRKWVSLQRSIQGQIRGDEQELSEYAAGLEGPHEFYGVTLHKFTLDSFRNRFVLRWGVGVGRKTISMEEGCKKFDARIAYVRGPEIVTPEQTEEEEGEVLQISYPRRVPFVMDVVLDGVPGLPQPVALVPEFRTVEAIYQ